MEAASIHITQLYCQTQVAWRDVRYTNTTALTENSMFVPPPHSPLKFPEVCNYPQKTFPDKAYSALVFTRMRLFCFVLFFFISLNLVDHSPSTPRLVYKGQSWTTHLLPFTLHLLVLSLLILDSWPYLPVRYLHLCLSLCQPHFFLHWTPLSLAGCMDIDLLPSFQLF